MSMLAERKRKEKWCLNPRGKAWSEDSNKFGQRILEKMGWSKGKGLGANEDGIKEHVRVVHKADNKGMGYKENEEQWTENEDQFSTLLKTLSAQTSNENGTDGTKADDSMQLQSLEKKSQNSRARVHYHKFTRGKDLSRYSEKDIANIFGKKDINQVKKLGEQEEQKIEETTSKKEESTILKETGTEQTSFGVTVIQRGTIQDYFSKRLNGLKQTLESNDNTESECETFGFGYKAGSSAFDIALNDDTDNLSNGKTKKKKRKLENEEGIELEIKQIKLDENMHKKSKKNKHRYEGNNLEINSLDILEPLNKKKVHIKNNGKSTYQDKFNLSCNEILEAKKKKNSKKHINEDVLSNNTNTLASDLVISKKKKKTSIENLELELDVEIGDTQNEIENLTLDLSTENKDGSSSKKSKKKKKHYSEQIEENIIVSQGIENLALELSMENENNSANMKRKKRKYDSEQTVKNAIILQGIENPALELSMEDDNPKNSNTNKNSEKKKHKLRKREDAVVSHGIENPALELSAENNSIDEKSKNNLRKTKKKKSEKNIAILTGYENSALKLNNTEFLENLRKKKKHKNNSENIDLGIMNQALQLSEDDSPRSEINHSKKDKENINENLDGDNSISEQVSDTKKSKRIQKSNTFGINNLALDLSDEFEINSYNDHDSQSACKIPKQSKKQSKVEHLGVENLALDLNCENFNKESSSVKSICNSFEVQRKKNKNKKNRPRDNIIGEWNEKDNEIIHLREKTKKRKYNTGKNGISNSGFNIIETEMETPVKKLKKSKSGIENPALNLIDEIPNSNIPTPKSALKKKNATKNESSIKLREHKRKKSVTINESLNREKYISDQCIAQSECSDTSLSFNSSLQNNSQKCTADTSNISEKIDSYQNELENSMNEAKEKKKALSPIDTLDGKQRKMYIFNNLKTKNIIAHFPGSNLYNLKGYGNK